MVCIDLRLFMKMYHIDLTWISVQTH